MNTFAFIIHPIDPKRDVSRKFPLLGKYLPIPLIHFFSTFFPPLYISEITGVTSEATGEELLGWFVACPYTPDRMLLLPEKQVYKKIIQTGKLAEKLGAKILGLGAFTSVVGDGGLTIAEHLDVPTTTGDAYTVAIAVEAVLKAASMVGIFPQTATAAVIGANGAIGQVCAVMLASEVGELILIGRTMDGLVELCEKIKEKSLNPTLKLRMSTDVSDINAAKLVISVTSALNTIIDPAYLQPGSVVCDVARPRDVSATVAAARGDILIIDGGMVDVPGPVNFNFDFGFPEGKAYACMAETMVLAFEGRLEDFGLGKEIRLEDVRYIQDAAKRHGFKLSGFRSFEKPVSEGMIRSIGEINGKVR